MPFITRSFYCEDPYFHKDSKYHIVWGGTRNTLVIYETNRNIIANITPHIISYKEAKNGKMNIAVSCGCEGCGLEFIDPTDFEKGIRLMEVRNYILSIREWNALYNFKNTGFELW